jgi:hypothetical protein
MPCQKNSLSLCPLCSRYQLFLLRSFLFYYTFCYSFLLQRFSPIFFLLQFFVCLFLAFCPYYSPSTSIVSSPFYYTLSLFWRNENRLMKSPCCLSVSFLASPAVSVPYIISCRFLSGPCRNKRK